ncbi:MAG: 50S ribosomal protein L24 [Halobacteriota archaeon]|nr:50S ribosomal protein L24 [Halobacteriota archaeon]
MTTTKSIQPRKQRKARYTAPVHRRNKFMRSPLSSELEKKYNKRNFGVIKGDTVKVMTGSFKGTEGKVQTVSYKDESITLDGVAISKADGSEVPRPIHPSNVMITKLNLKDKLREERITK